MKQLILQRRTTVLIFWALRCAPCIREMNTLQRLYQQFKDSGLLVLAVEAAGNDPAEIAEMLEQMHAVGLSPTYPIIPDPGSEVTRKFGVKVAPKTFLINRDGVIISIFDYFSRIDEAELIGTLENIFYATTAAAVENPHRQRPPPRNPHPAAEGARKMKPLLTKLQTKRRNLKKNGFLQISTLKGGITIGRFLSTGDASNWTAGIYMFA